MRGIHIFLLLVFLALCHSHAVLPLLPAAPSYHSYVPAPYPLIHHGYAGYGLLGHGLATSHLGHHLLKRSPHYVEPLAHLGHVGPVTYVAPLSVSHQAHVDLHTSAAIVAPVPIVKPLVAPVLPVSVLHKVLDSPLHYGAGLHGGFYPHSSHY